MQSHALQQVRAFELFPNVRDIEGEIRGRAGFFAILLSVFFCFGTARLDETRFGVRQEAMHEMNCGPVQLIQQTLLWNYISTCYCSN